MKEEIKEYLDYFKKYATISEKAILEDIEDYITNLQKENEKLTWIKNGELGKVVREKMVDKLSADEMIVIQQNIIDKAISLLKEAGFYDEETKTFCDDVWEELPDLLNILQGEDTNVER